MRLRARRRSDRWTLTTSKGGRVGILSQDVYVQLDIDTQLAVRSQSGGPELRVVSGAVRIVDTRLEADAPRFVIATPHFSAAGRGGDTEVWVSAAAGQNQSRICAHEASV
jgi:ferric-dicitrate binding protein FerR (iron transport regulator)